MFTNSHPDSSHKLAEIRHEPQVLSDILVDDEPERPQKQGTSRHLAVTLAVSTGAHLLIFAVATWSASKASRNSLNVESRPHVHSVQIRILDSTPRSRQDALTAPDVAAEPAPSELTASEITEVAESPPQPEMTAAEPVPAVIAAEPSVPEPDTAPSPVSGTDTPRLVMPSSQDLRAMIQNRAATDRQRSLETLCEQTQQRHLMMDCGPADGSQDIALAERNEIVEHFNRTPIPKTTEPRVKANLDIIDAQLGTTQTKKRLWGIP